MHYYATKLKELKLNAEQVEWIEPKRSTVIIWHQRKLKNAQFVIRRL